ncbi:circadian clock-controlled protein daywake-like [Leguminivora glycinivorella]|uniref:circadian clock-controlled protein daywake-like n=1 Tax=Leguminivora glycinivorella TaxID=1035111 RepID=UPI0020102C4E|nr:circadian clock-controlled protein daywake-like [Leguminivora glycinivorella]XP_047990838.1 circadian clock-controlled protein daywake-like [Leguminivora glycinivorella]
MNWQFSFLCIAVLFIDYGFTRLTPDFIHPCPVDNRECLIQSTIDAIPFFTKGIPELGVPSLDPFYVDRLAIPLAGLKVAFFNGKVTGFRKAVIENVESNFAKRKFVVEFRSNVTLKGGYEASGRILTFPINGEGEAKIKITNLKMKVKMNIDVKPDDNGVNHLYVKNYKYDYGFGDKAHYNLTNLVKDSPELSQTLLQFMNENWKLIAEEFGKPLVDYATELALRTIEKFFLAVPYEELIDGPIPSFK